ncbi:sensor histidine kinase [Wukongibacter baidiensis]|uniref:sensor histidine kinase n=1 Tax=Wukongibacter baidiensis TaxID=1723361 RepID=UPI003D7F8316
MRSLKYKIMIPVFLVATLGIILLSYLTYNESKQIVTGYVEVVIQDKVEKLVNFIDGELKEWTNQVELLASIDEVKKMEHEKFFLKMLKFEEISKQYEVFLISDKNGNFIASNGCKGNIIDRDYFRKAINGQTVISEPIACKLTGNPIILIAAPIRNDNGDIIGLIGATINLVQITDSINQEKLGDSGYAYMVNSKGKTIAHPRAEFLLKNTLKHSESTSFQQIIKDMVDRETGIGFYNFEGEKKMIYYKPISSIDWSVGMAADYNEATKGVLILRNSILFLGLVIVIIILLILYFLTEALVKPINTLKTYMEIASKGDFSVHSDISSKDEIGVLSDSFNTLIKENKRLLDETIKYDKMKTEFFSNISHELKTPLNIIFSSTQLLYLCTSEAEEDISPAKLNKYIDMIKQNSYRLLRLVNNLIDITKIDSGFMELNVKNENIVEVVENITLSTAEYVKSKCRNIVFDTEIEEKIIAFDPEKMERIILNLISNAVKFTKAGDSIAVMIYDRKDAVQISVKDSGIGIPENKQKIIFDKFIQANPLYSRSNEGSGIGLSLVKSLVEMHGGKVIVRSEEGNGTEFVIELPVKLIYEEKKNHITEEFSQQSNVEKIQIEFSDIYD